MLVVPVRRSSRCVTVRAPLPACRVTWKVASRAPSGAKAAELVPTRSRTLPTKARARVGGGRATVKPAARTATWPSGLVTVTSRGPRAAVAPTARATESWVHETTVAEVTVTSAPKAALAPGARGHTADRRDERQERGGRGRGAIGEIGSDGVARPTGEERGVDVGGEHDEGPAVGDGEVDGAVGGAVQERAVESAGGAEGPVDRRGVAVPDAGGARAAQLEVRDGARAAAGLQGHLEGAVEGAGRGDGGGAGADPVAHLADEGQGEGRG